MILHKCPVCNGTGLVLKGFYDHPQEMAWTIYGDNTPEKCRSCNGKGIIKQWEEGDETPIGDTITL